MKNITNNKSIILISIFSTLSIILLIYYGLSNQNQGNYNKLKEYKSKELIYTKEEKESDDYNQYIPYVNLKTELGTLINQNIDDYINGFENSNTGITYDYDLNGKVLSLIIKVEDHSFLEGAAILYFNSYNINLDTSELLSNETITNYFDMDTNQVQSKLNNKIESYYDELVDNNIINQTICNYECFLNSRNLNNNNNDIEYFIKDGKLYVYKPYIYIYSSEDDKIKYSFKISE